MANIVFAGEPNTSHALSKTITTLKKLPDTFTVLVRLLQNAYRSPEIIIVTHEQKVLVLKVWDFNTEQAKNLSQPSLFDRLLNRPTPDLTVGNSEVESLQSFSKQIKSVGILTPLAMAIAAPLLAKKESKTIKIEQVPLLTKEDFELVTLTEKIQTLAKFLDTDALEKLRTIHTPESEVPAQITARRKINRNREASTTPMLLSYHQESILKNDLYLPEEGQKLARDIDLRLVNGVAGSGKSLIILYRAKLIKSIFPQRRILIITFNRPLIADLEYRYEQINGANGIEWRGLHSWCGAQLKDVSKKPYADWERKNIITQLRPIYFSEKRFSDETLLKEIDWIKDNLIFSRETYVQMERKGRKIGLTRPLREKIYDLFEAYQKAMAFDRWDYADMPRELYFRVQEGKINLPQYDEILIDEAQFFAPVWWELMKSALATNGRLFVVADPSQGFLKRQLTWKSLGFNVMGRSVKLDRSYRTTREIMELARNWYRVRMTEYAEDNEDSIEPTLVEMTKGDSVAFISTPTESDGLKRLQQEIQLLLEQNVAAEHILILTSGYGYTKNVAEYLKSKFPQQKVVSSIDGSKSLATKAIKICSLDAATGLEAPIVFILGIEKYFAAERDPRLGDDERAELVLENTRRLYMAITRAGQKAILMSIGEFPSLFTMAQHT